VAQSDQSGRALLAAFAEGAHRWALSTTPFLEEHCCDVACDAARLLPSPDQGCTSFFSRASERTAVARARLEKAAAARAEEEDPSTLRFPKFRRNDSSRPLDEHPWSEEEVHTALGEYLDRVCCVEPLTANAKWMLETNVTARCSREHCIVDMHRRGVARMGRRMRHELRSASRVPSEERTFDYGRRMEETTPPKTTRAALSPAQQVAIDLLNDHTHPIAGCEHVMTPGATRKSSISNSECAIRGVVHRIAEYHQVDTKKVMSFFDVLGHDFAEMLANAASLVTGDGAASRHERTFDPEAERQARAKQELVERQVRARAELVFGRRLAEDGEDAELDDDVLQAKVHHSDARLHSAAETFHDASGWSAGAGGVADEMHGLARRSAMRDTTHAAETGTLEAISLDETTHGFERATTMASFVISADGSFTRIARDASRVARSAMVNASALLDEIRLATSSPLSSPSGAPSALDELSATIRAQIDVVGAYAHGTSPPPSAPPPSAPPPLRVDRRKLRSLVDAFAAEVVRNSSASRGRQLHGARTTGEVVGDRLRMPDDLPYERGPVHTFMIESIDWRTALRFVDAFVAEERQRMRWWSEGAHDAHAHDLGLHDGLIGRTVGVGLPPTAIGRMFRTIGHAIQHGRFPDWEVSGALQREVERHRDALNDPTITKQSSTTSFAPLRHLGRDEVNEVADFEPSGEIASPQQGRRRLVMQAPFDGRNRGGRGRRVAEEAFESFGKGIFGGTLAVPMSGRLHNTDGSKASKDALELQKNAATIVDSSLSYIIYNVFLCYLYKPHKRATTQTLNDCTAVYSHGSDHMCAPAIPLSIPVVPTFEQMLGINHSVVTETTIEELCGPMMVPIWWLKRADAISDTFRLGPLPKKTMRRMVQNPAGFITVTSNLGAAFAANTTAKRSVHVACALSRTNGLLWTVFFILVFMSLYLACCWPCWNAFAVCLRFCRDRPRDDDDDD